MLSIKTCHPYHAKCHQITNGNRQHEKYENEIKLEGQKWRF